MTSKNFDSKFEVFFDGDCPLCRREIDMIRRHDQRERIIFTDISESDFSCESKSLTTLMKEIHGRYEDGTFVTGVQVFRELYGRIGFPKAVWLSGVPGIRHVLDLGYHVFAKFRFWSAMRRMKKQKTSLTCNTKSCQSIKSLGN